MILGEKQYRLTLLGGEEIEFWSLSASTADQVYSTICINNDNPLYTEYLFNLITKNKYVNEDLQAGILSLTIFLSLKTSGIIKEPKDLPNVYDEARNKVSSNIFYAIYAEILKTFNTYKLEELKKKTTKEIFELLALSERVSGNQLFDTDKMRQSIETPGAPVTKQKGVKSITADEIDLIKNILANEEAKAGDFPGY